MKLFQMPMLDAGVRIPQRRWVGIVDNIPGDLLNEWAAKIFTLMNLAWQYVDTILDIVIQMKLRETKPLVRVIRQIKLDYDRFRSRSIDDDAVRQETAIAETFEERMSGDFRRLFYGLDFEINKLGLDKDWKPIVIAVQQALTVMDAVRIYARRRDVEIRRDYRIDVKDCCLIQEDFMRLYTLVPQFAGDCYQPDLPARKTTANILANRMEVSIINIIDKNERDSSTDRERPTSD